MSRILKYSLPPYGEATVQCNSLVRWLAVGWQHDQLVVWADALAGEEVAIGLYVAQTGEETPPGEWIGSAQLVSPSGPYVVHVFEVGRA